MLSITALFTLLFSLAAVNATAVPRRAEGGGAVSLSSSSSSRISRSGGEALEKRGNGWPFGGGGSNAPPQANPQVASVNFVGNLQDPNLQRDSCGSTRWGDRLLVVCRDTEYLVNQDIAADVYNGTQAGFTSSSASYMDFAFPGDKPTVEPWTPTKYVNFTTQVPLYGSNSLTVPFYPNPPGECADNGAGACPDGSRYALWPDSPPTVTCELGDLITAYTWVKNSHIKGLTALVQDPSVALYKVTSAPLWANRDTLPSVELVNGQFWQENQIPFGDYGTVIQGEWLYLYGQTSNQSHIAVARVHPQDVEDVSQYSYYLSGQWGSEQPTGVNDTRAWLDHPGAGGQGTYYYVDGWQSFVWLGQLTNSATPNPRIAVSPAAEGPWTESVQIDAFPGGDYFFPGYSIQAHPGITPLTLDKEIYVSYTKDDGFGPNNFAVYNTPMYHFTWQ
ncbi:hypothetical protein BD324DRAFT_635116 [Kockovaella imperatae]|uniref:DUF4185 domain-containing protein n=1 Tax=Kockovaella imperatae TaxID=4999 RepID=A0A1Y1UBA2_9TREE|nr:hypothetical protein BD324DRAFT_635116 [Kockovaella imperatae]ORX34814.1 hypothetical protein BD324DRAFT_635116 [Kockovaella imperatae]